MKTYEVLVSIEGHVRIEADSMLEAEEIALSAFDPTAYDPLVVESFEVEEENV